MQRAFLMVLALLSLVSTTTAQQREIGHSDWGLPGISRVGVPYSSTAGLGVAGGAGYAATEPLNANDEWHHRAAGSAAFGVAPLPWLGLSLKLSGHMDVHAGGDTSAVGDPRLLIRAGHPINEKMQLGTEVILWMPGQEAPSLDPSATTVDGRLLFAYEPNGALTLASMAGFRFDQSANSVSDASLVRPQDRLTIGVSDFNAVLLGVGVSQRLAALELLGEFSWDLLVGSGAPDPGQSPMRLSAGVRYHVIAGLELGAMLNVGLSGRPDTSATAPLVPIEPRLGVMTGLRWWLPFGGRAKSEAEPEPEPEPEPRAEPKAEPKTTPAVVATVPAVAAPAKAAPASVRGLALDDTGAAIVGGRVELLQDEELREATTDAEGRFVLNDVPVGASTVTLTADGHEEVSQPVQVKAGGSVELKLETRPAHPEGQIRGVIRSFGGKPLTATAKIYPIGLKTKTDAEGRFEIDVPPGKYRIRIRSYGFKSQNRDVVVPDRGVTVLNVELRKK